MHIAAHNSTIIAIVAEMLRRFSRLSSFFMSESNCLRSFSEILPFSNDAGTGSRSICLIRLDMNLSLPGICSLCSCIKSFISFSVAAIFQFNCFCVPKILSNVSLPVRGETLLFPKESQVSALSPLCSCLPYKKGVLLHALPRRVSPEPDRVPDA